MEYISVTQAAEKWGISDRRVRALCAQGKIEGVLRGGHAYKIPAGALRPGDGRKLRGKPVSGKYGPLFARIDARAAQLNRLRPHMEPRFERLYDEFAVEYTYHSTAIEGNTLTLQETAQVLGGMNAEHKPQKDHLEAIGHQNAFRYICSLASGRTRLTEKTIREIHSIALMDRPDDAGVYRRIQVRALDDAHKPPPPQLVPRRMEQLLAENREKKTAMHPLERIAWFHLKFEDIHPFLGGNGRVGRLVMNFDLMRNDYLPVNVKLSERAEYFRAFDQWHRAGDPEPMVRLLAAHEEDQLARCLRALS